MTPPDLVQDAAIPPWPNALTSAVVGLGLTQIIAWGSIYYALAVLGPSITRDLGWDAQWTYVGFSVALIIAGIAAPVTGRFIDQIGGRKVMSLGSIVAACGLGLLASCSDWFSYLAAWMVLGLAKAMVLYEAAFATLAQISIARARRAITYLSFFGGLASTVAWPATRFLHDAIGWRETLAVYSGLALFVCLPIHWLTLSSTVPNSEEHSDTQRVEREPAASPRVLSLVTVMLSISFGLTAFMWSGISVHLLSMLGLFGFSTAAGVALGALIGPSQVFGRVIDMVFGSKFHPLTVLQLSSTLLPLAFAVLASATATPWATAVFAILYG